MSAKLIYHTSESIAGGASPFDVAITEIAKGQRVEIVCPYLGLDYLQRITGIALDWRLLTDIAEWLSIHAVSQRNHIVDFVLANKARVRHCDGLHAKVLIAGKRALVGSANLTNHGITRRLEVSVELGNDGLVQELRQWFKSAWELAGPLQASETNLRAFVESIPEPSVRSGVVPLTSAFPKVRASLVKIGTDKRGANQAATPIPATRLRRNTEIDVLLSSRSPSIRKLINELRVFLENDGANGKTSKSDRTGDIRHYYGRENFSMIRLCKNWVRFHLRIDPRWLSDPDFTWEKSHQGTLGYVKLMAGQPIPKKVIEWIELAKRFIRGRR